MGARWAETVAWPQEGSSECRTSVQRDYFSISDCSKWVSFYLRIHGTRYVNVWSDLNGFVLWMVGHCGRWSPRWWVRVVTWHGSCAVELRVMSPHYSYCARTCQDVRLCLVVCVHPIGIDDPQRMVTAHLVAVAKLVWVREENTDKYHEWGIMICHVHFVFKRQVSRHLLRKKSPVIILKWSEGKWLYILYSCIL